MVGSAPFGLERNKGKWNNREGERGGMKEGRRNMFVVQMSVRAQRAASAAAAASCLFRHSHSLSLSSLLLLDAHDPLFGHVDKLGEEIHPPAPVVEN